MICLSLWALDLLFFELTVTQIDFRYDVMCILNVTAFCAVHHHEH